MKENILSFLFYFVISLQLSLNTLNAQEVMPNKDSRIYSLSLIWSEMKYNFAFPETLHKVNIDSLYLAYIPKIENVNSNYEYFRVLNSFMAHFNEAHTRIYTAVRPDDMSPIKASNIGKNIFIINISKKYVNEIPIGSEILKINGIPIINYLEDSIYQYISAATPHWKFDKSVSEMFYGEPNSAINITIKTPNGKEKEVEMIRNYLSQGAMEEMVVDDETPPIKIEMIDKNIGYIKLSTCLRKYVDTINTVFNNNLPELKKSKAIIIDIRGNRGGTDVAWENIAYHIIPDSQIINRGKWESRIHIATYKNWGEYEPQLKGHYDGTSMMQIKHGAKINKVNDSMKLKQPIIIISGKEVGSAAEDFLMLMKEYERATIIGEPTVGSMGEPSFFSINKDFDVMLCSKRYIDAQNNQPNDKGILPDIYVESSYELYLKGRDNILEKAIDMANSL